jgi:hypothetical protein
MSKHKSKQKPRYRVASKAARDGSLCLMGQILFLLGGPSLVARLWRWR